MASGTPKGHEEWMRDEYERQNASLPEIISLEDSCVLSLDETDHANEFFCSRCSQYYPMVDLIRNHYLCPNCEPTNCGACVYFYRMPEPHTQTLCRRYPPESWYQDGVVSVFPQVKECAWCGEFSRKLRKP